MENKCIIELTEEKKKIVAQALYFAKTEFERKALKNRQKESGSGIFTIVADRMERKAHKMLRVFLKFTDTNPRCK